ncbi:MAG: tyrosine-type recombinase/integrase [Rhodospirillales bacterium]|nr:tyrosine-type recombinase/integrase [Rhodospirillales bacterium]
MTAETTRNAFADPAALTLGDVQRRLNADPALPPQRRREIASAINSTALWLHQHPDQIPANHDFLRRAFARLSHGTLGVGLPRFRNVQSLVKAGLAAAGVPSSGVSYLAPLDPAWSALWDSIEDSYTKECLARFMRYCSTQDITPDRVDQGAVAAFGAALAAENLTARPEIATQSAIRLWNRMVDSSPSWPRVRLAPILRRELYTLPWSDLPDDLVADIERYLDILGGKDLTDPLAPPRPLAPRSVDKRRYELLQLISAFHHKGGTVADLHGLADLCRVEVVRKALPFFIERYRAKHGADADPTTSSMIAGIADAVRAAAKHYVKAPSEVVDELTRIANRFRRRQIGMCEKARLRLAQLDDPEVERRLLSHAPRELRKLIDVGEPTRRDAERFSVLLATEILLLAPMRIENLAELHLDRHFIWPSRRGGQVGIIVPRGDVKNRQPLDYLLPETSAAYLDVFIERFRPLLLSGNDSRALFPGQRRVHKRPDSIARQVKEMLRSAVGIKWNVHAYRHLAVRIYLRAHPGDYEGARRLLAHINIATTTRIYSDMEMRPVVERYDQLIESRRSTAPATPRASRRRRPPGGGEKK